MISVSAEQQAICDRVGSPAIPVDPMLKLGVAISTLGLTPFNALRHPVTETTCGWYVWGGKYSAADDFFQPMHVAHLTEYAPIFVPYLALAPGWGVILAPDYEDIWYDPKFLDV